MKEVGTVAMKQSRNISRQTPTIGLDLGDRNSWHCVLDEAGHYKRSRDLSLIGIIVTFRTL
jgi:hypothetical protein